MSETKARKKTKKRIPVPVSGDTDDILVGLQGQYQVKHKQKIHKADMAGLVLDKMAPQFEL